MAGGKPRGLHLLLKQDRDDHKIRQLRQRFLDEIRRRCAPCCGSTLHSVMGCAIWPCCAGMRAETGRAGGPQVFISQDHLLL
jgi:hypothetical protein